MKAIAGFMSGALLMAIVGAIALTMGRLDRDIAHAQEHIISREYSEPRQIFQKAERYDEYASRLPWIGNGPLNDMRARQASLQYWQRQYTAIVPEVSDPVANVPSDNLALQFVMANAMFREGLAVATNKVTTIAALDAASNAYLTVLRNAVQHEDAAYNYEYVARLRNEIDKGRRKDVPPPSGTRDGARGGHPEAAVNDAQFKLYVPLDRQEQEKAQAGKDAPIKKKG